MLEQTRCEDGSRSGCGGTQRRCIRFDLAFRSENTSNTALLVPAKPRLASLAQNLATEVVDELADNNENERDWVHPVHTVFEDFNANDDTPKVHGQERDVEEGSRRETEQERCSGIED